MKDSVLAHCSALSLAEKKRIFGTDYLVPQTIYSAQTKLTLLATWILTGRKHSLLCYRYHDTGINQLWQETNSSQSGHSQIKQYFTDFYIKCFIHPYPGPKEPQGSKMSRTNRNWRDLELALGVRWGGLDGGGMSNISLYIRIWRNTELQSRTSSTSRNWCVT